MHDKLGNRGAWDPHSVAGWNIGTSIENHRMFNLFEKSTGAERVSDTVFLKHKYPTQPLVSPEDTIVVAAQQLTSALKGNAKKTTRS